MTCLDEIRVEIPLELICGDDKPTIKVRGVFFYRPDDPHAVHAHFYTGTMDEHVEWVFGRDLVSTGLTRETGLGDVRIWPNSPGGRGVVYFSLSSPEGEALLECPRQELSAFIDRCYEVVPYGAEDDFLDVDAAIEAILGEGL